MRGRDRHRVIEGEFRVIGEAHLKGRRRYVPGWVWTLLRKPLFWLWVVGFSFVVATEGLY